MSSRKISPMRTVGYDPGLLSREELLATHHPSRRRTLEELIASEKLSRQSRTVILLKRVVKAVRWFIDNAQLRISVRKSRLRLSYGIFRQAIPLTRD
jgi:hypothetical protein